jgi:hypothetical protein
MHDAIEIERHGVPASIVSTDLFEPTARQLAVLQGVPDFPLVLIPHPLGRCSPDELKLKAERVLDDIIGSLTNPE